MGEGKPKIPHPEDKNWNGLSLPWMAYGYGVSLTPIQILSYYNAIANNGELLKPLFVKTNGVDKIVLNPSICSKETLAYLKDMLEGVVNENGGTAYNIKTDKYKIAGKTGTCQVDYNTNNVQYISTFVGYFPADKPKYSCIVVIHKPDKKKGYYGNVVAAPVFKTISDKIFSSIPQLENIVKWNQLKNTQNEFNSVPINIIESDFKKIKGKNFFEILPILENLGYSVEHIGEGLIVKDYKVEQLTKNKKIVKIIS